MVVKLSKQIFIRQLIREGWRSCEAKTSKDKKRSCFVSPDGKWYNVPFYHHQIFAYYVFKDLYPEMKSTSSFLPSGIDYKNAGDVLVKKGWIFVQDNPIIGTILRGWEKMTLKQYKVLYSYFGNQRLVRGWTITLLYRESKGE